MDRDQFDRLSRLVAAAGTRRDALRLLLAGGAAGVAGHASTSEARKRRGRGRQQRGRVRAAQETVCTIVCDDCSGKPIRPGANLAECNLADESFIDGLNLSSANVSEACFARSSLRAARFSGANASGACFIDATLRGASFRGANVHQAVFCGADLTGADFRGSNVTQAQLDCATVGCNTILPNGKPAEVCPPGARCCAGECASNNDPENCGACGNRCGPCRNCQNGQCVAKPNLSFACDGSALRPAGDAHCTTNPNTGVCVDGACACGPGGEYDRDLNVCTCDAAGIAECRQNAPDPEQCCRIGEVCVDIQGGVDTLQQCVICFAE
jgi:hypothetical protein